MRGSRFLADAIPVEDRPAAEAFLEEIRKRFYDATHHCYAYRIGPAGSSTGSTMTGNRAIPPADRSLQPSTRTPLTNVLVIVTRYFGGTKLGVGGLVRAYGDAAAAALAGAGRPDALSDSGVLDPVRPSAHQHGDADALRPCR